MDTLIFTFLFFLFINYIYNAWNTKYFVINSKLTFFKKYGFPFILTITLALFKHLEFAPLIIHDLLNMFTNGVINAAIFGVAILFISVLTHEKLLHDTAILKIQKMIFIIYFIIISHSTIWGIMTTKSYQRVPEHIRGKYVSTEYNHQHTITSNKLIFTEAFEPSIEQIIIKTTINYNGVIRFNDNPKLKLVSKNLKDQNRLYEYNFYFDTTFENYEKYVLK